MSFHRSPGHVVNISSHWLTLITDHEDGYLRIAVSGSEEILHLTRGEAHLLAETLAVAATELRDPDIKHQVL